MMKKVTIMIPTYNQSQYIEQCIDSALRQDYPNLEVIISDDSTNNETEKIVQEKYLSDPRVKYFHNIPALGRVGNYHKTLYEYATGEYVTNLDGDDFFIDYSYISSAVKILDKHDEVSFVFADIFDFYGDEILYNKLVDLEYKVINGNDFFIKINTHNIPNMEHLSGLYRRKDALKVGFYEVDVLSSDRVSIYKLIAGKKIIFINKTVGVWRKHLNNASSSEGYKPRIDNLQVPEVVSSYIHDNKLLEESFIERWRKDTIFKMIHSYSVMFLDKGEYSQFIQFISNAISLYPIIGLKVLCHYKVSSRIIFPPLWPAIKKYRYGSLPQ